MDSKTINQFPIRDYLAGIGICPAKDRGYYGLYHSPLREDGDPSMKVDYEKNLWIDFGTGEGGTLIDLVMRLERCGAGLAMHLLEQTISGALSFSSHGNTPAPSRSTELERPRISIVSVGELRHPALVEYLRERGLDLTAARMYCNEVRYQIGDREYFAIGFRNDAGGWELRNRNFKGGSTPKNITTIRGGGNGDTMIGTATASDTVMVFEGFIDFLSYLSLKQNPSPTIDTAVLNSVANLRRAIPFLESHHTVHAFLDNDEAGRKTLDGLRESLPCSEVVDQSVFYRSHKDLNDYWREQAAPKPRVENRMEDTDAADTVKRPAPIERITPADRFRRSMPAVPVKKRGRGV